MLAPIGVTAQVTIGSGKVPSEWSLLDLDASVTKKALHLPRLMQETERDVLIPPFAPNEDAEGILIFNAETKCLDYWNGEKWVSLCEGDESSISSITCEPDYYDVDVSKYVDITVMVPADNRGGISGIKRLRFLTYNLGANPALSPKQQMAYSGADMTDITVYGGLYQRGRKDVSHSFRCQPVNGDASTDPRFTTTPITMPNGNDDGKLVWGVDDLFLFSDNYNCTDLLGTAGNMPVKGSGDPCPVGWRIPTRHEWALLGNEDGSSTSTNNDYFYVSDASGTIPSSGIVWVPVKNGAPSINWTNDNSLDNKRNYGNLNGYALYVVEDWNSNFIDKASLIDADDPEPLMFLPAAGMRDTDDGRLQNTGDDGYYWELASNDCDGYQIGAVQIFYSSMVSAKHANYGYDSAVSVRCIAE
ncbi:MAG: hypothetical protein LBR75_06895 [Prevotellaceae bacterium]|nr:hypothetical protein [Prevotellaceae bacterium]